MSELLPSGGSERYGACADEVDVGDDGNVSQLLISHLSTTPFIWQGPVGPVSKEEAGNSPFPTLTGYYTAIFPKTQRLSRKKQRLLRTRMTPV